MTAVVEPLTEPDTPQPFYLTGPQPSEPPARMDPHEKIALRNAAFRAKKAYPGPVGAFLNRELLAIEELGFRFAQGSEIAALVRQVMTVPLPVQPDDEAAA